MGEFESKVLTVPVWHSLPQHARDGRSNLVMVATTLR